MFNLYPDDIVKFTSKGTIPKLIKPDEQLTVHRRYYFPDFNQKFKCLSIEESPEGFIFYYLWGEQQYQYVLPHPISYPCYKFVTDKCDILNQDIINDRHIYYGYQIRWWFYRHRINSSYVNFINRLGQLEDDSSYMVSGVLQNSKYVNCAFVKRHRRGV